MPRRMLPLLLVLVLAGCGGGSSISKQSLSKLVLRRQDVGAHFAPFYSGPQTRLDTQGTPRSDPGRFGREGGWIVRFHRTGKPAPGPLVVESRADLFGAGSGAKQDLDLYRKALATGLGAQHRKLSVSRLGDDAIGDTFVQPGGRPLRFFRIAWRYENATAEITVEGFAANLSAADAIALARKQQHRLQNA